MKDSVYVINKRLWASDRRRFISCILDFFFVYVTMFAFSFVVVMVGNIFNWDIFAPWTEILSNHIYLIFLSFLMFNYLVMECFFGRSFGKLILGTTVVNKNGLKPSLGFIIIRTLSRLIPFDVLSFLGKSGRMWHDSLSNTFVVEKKELEKDKEIFYNLNSIGIKEVN